MEENIQYYLALKNDAIFGRIMYPIGLKVNITNVDSHDYVKIKICLYKN